MREQGFFKFNRMGGKLENGGKISPDSAHECANLSICLFADRNDRQESNDGTRNNLPGSGGTGHRRGGWCQSDAMRL